VIKQQIAGNKRIIYVAGPYHHQTEEGKRENILHAIRVALRLWELGFFVICPHCNTANFEFYTNLPQEVWGEGYLEILKRCDAIFMMRNWETSEGAKSELEVAIERGMAVYYE